MPHFFCHALKLLHSETFRDYSSVYRGKPKTQVYHGILGFMEYVEQRNGGYYVAGTRVSLDSVVYAFLRGETPVEIADSFQALTLQQIHGAIAFYLANREMVDAYLVRQRQEFERMRQEAREEDPAFYAKMDAARRARHTVRS
jgi:uncharacterized protein (DUF433 family)